MTEIRLRYTGITAYAASLITTFTGMLFTLLITRKLSPDELGVWRYIGSLITYFVIPPGLIGYWTTRMTAQGKQVLATSLSIASLSTIATTFLFITLSDTFGRQVGTSYLVFIIAALEIPLISIHMVLESALTARRPERVYYSIIIQELVKLPLVIVFVILLRFGLIGAILSTILGFTARAVALFIFVSEFGIGRPDWRTASQILRRMWLPLYSGLPNNIAELQFIAVVMSLGSGEVLGYASAVLLIGSIVALSGNLSSGLYPKLLQSQSPSAVETSLKMVLMIAIPSSVGGMILAEHVLNLLRPDYRMVSPVVIIALPGTILYLINNIMDATLMGQERADFDESASFRRLVKSRLFLVPTINIIQSITYITVLIPILLHASNLGLASLLMAWFLTQTLIIIPFLIYKVKISGQPGVLLRAVAPAARYLISSSVMGLVVYLLKPSTIPAEISSALAQLIPVLAAGVIIYFVFLYAIDGEFRALIRMIATRIPLTTKLSHY